MLLPSTLDLRSACAQRIASPSSATSSNAIVKYPVKHAVTRSQSLGSEDHDHGCSGRLITTLDNNSTPLSHDAITPSSSSNSKNSISSSRMDLSALAINDASDPTSPQQPFHNSPFEQHDHNYHQQQQQQHYQQQQHQERLPRCSTVSLQTELASPELVVFSGGTAFNSVAGPLRKLTTAVSHVLPVSDDGGSTAEIVRVIGGPAVGDIRSRCLRLADDRDQEARAVKRLLAHRLTGSSSQEAKLEWYEIVEGVHPLWGGVSEPYKHMIRAFLVHFQLQILSQVTQQDQFNFKNGSIGNFFFAGARTFFRSLESAVFLFSRVSRIPQGSTVLPAICTEEVITLGAQLQDNTVIRGQNNISHPSNDTSCTGEAAGPSAVDKSDDFDPLPSAVSRVFYLSREGTGQEHEVAPQPNPRVLQAIQSCDAVLYGMGSLYTSICATLILDGVGEAIAARQDVPKLLLLNGSHDRETSTCSSHPGPMCASDVVAAVTDALNRRNSTQGAGPLSHPCSSYISCLITPRGGAIQVDRQELQQQGICQVVEVPSSVDAEGRVVYDPEDLVQAIGQLMYAQSAAGVTGGQQQQQ